MWSKNVYFRVLVPFCPTKENVPFENQRSLASFTRCAAADRFVNSNPVMNVSTDKRKSTIKHTLNGRNG